MRIILSDIAIGDVKKLSKKYKSIIKDLDCFFYDIREHKNIEQITLKGFALIV